MRQLRTQISSKDSFMRDTFFHGTSMEAMLKTLVWDKQSQFSGQLMPPRPGAVEMRLQKTPLGPLVVHRGVVMQRGPYGSVILRCGCVPKHPWHDLWQTLREFVNYLVEAEQRKVQEDPDYLTFGVYAVISLRAMQAIDFGWLVHQGFRFHHYRAAGHGETPVSQLEALELSELKEGANQPASIATPNHVDDDNSKTRNEGNAEFVYYCWPGQAETDMVPSYTTAIEGVTGLTFSPDGDWVLLSWERKAWSTNGGAKIR